MFSCVWVAPPTPEHRHTHEDAIRASVARCYLLVSLQNWCWLPAVVQRGGETGPPVGAKHTQGDFNPSALSGRREGTTHCITSCTAKQALKEGQLLCHPAYLLYCWPAQGHFLPHQVRGMVGPLAPPWKRNKCCVRPREANEGDSGLAHLLIFLLT